MTRASSALKAQQARNGKRKGRKRLRASVFQVHFGLQRCTTALISLHFPPISLCTGESVEQAAGGQQEEQLQQAAEGQEVLEVVAAGLRDEDVAGRAEGRREGRVGGQDHQHDEAFGAEARAFLGAKASQQAL